MSNIYKLTRDGYLVPKTSKNKKEILKLKAALTVKPEKKIDYGGEVESFSLYKETETDLIIPRYFGTKLFGNPKNLIDIKKSQVSFEFPGSLRGTQPEVAKVAIEKIKKEGGGILQLHTGYGKTVLALYIASVFKLKTLIIVHKTFLQDQWYNRIKQFTDANVGIIRQKKVDIENKDIVIGMLQSISMIDYDPEIFKEFDMVFIDEIHRGASKVYSRALLKICPKYTIGLSATPIRQDGLTKVLNWFIGDILIKVERTGDNAVYIKSFDYESNDKLFVEKKRWVKGTIVPDTVKMITNLYQITSRNILITNIVNSLRKKDERKILVMSHRIDHLTTLKKMLDKIIEEDIKNGLCNEDEYKTAFYIGGMKEYELDDASTADVLFGTYSMAEEGLDIDGLNTLVLATPKKNIIQSIGRILRKPIKEGDINPLVVEINDLLSCIQNWGRKRETYYEKKNYNYCKYKAYNDKVISFRDHMIEKGIIKKTDKLEDLEELRKAYIIHELGEADYEFERDTGFEGYPLEMFKNQPTNYDEIFEIKHIFEENNTEKKVHIDWSPKKFVVNI
jgi:superfamily II DNA or RNA helicase